MGVSFSLLEAEERNGLRAYRLERVWAAMREAGHDVLVIAGRYDAWQIGYLRYVTDWRPWAGHGYAVLPLEKEPVLILPARSQTHWATSGSWSETIHAQDPVAEIASRLRAVSSNPEKIGVCGLSMIMPHAEAEALKQAFPAADLVEAGGVIDKARAIKSTLELRLMKEDAAAVQTAFEVFASVLKPGRSEWEIVAEAHAAMKRQGGFDGIAHLANEALPFIHPPTSRLIQPDDVVKFSIEYTGPHGFWTELAGIFSFAEPDAESRRRYATIRKAFDEASAMMRPGTVGGEIIDRIHQVYEEDGWDVTDRGIWDVHGIGIDVIEWPTVLEGDKTELQQGMVLCLHPGLLIGEDRWGVYIQDSFVVTPDGGQQLSSLSHDWNVLDPNS